MKKSVVLLVVASILLLANCSNPKMEDTYRVFRKGNKYAIAKADADSTKLSYKYDKVEVQASSWSAGGERPWINFSERRTTFYKGTYFKVQSGFDGYGIWKDDSLIIPCKYDYFYELDDFNVSPQMYSWIVGKNNKYGLFTKDGKSIFPISYNFNQIFLGYDGYLMVRDSNSNKVSLYTGKKVIGPFDNVYSRNGIFLFEDSTINGIKSGLINSLGKKILEFPYETTVPAGHGLYRVQLDGSEGFIDSLGKIIIPLKEYEALGYPDCGLIFYVEKSDTGYYDLGGRKTIFKKILKNCFTVSRLIQGTIVVKNNDGNFGLVDRNGKVIIPCEYYLFLTEDQSSVIFRKSGIEAMFDRKTGKIVKFL
jgi:hypothetical protein